MDLMDVMISLFLFTAILTIYTNIAVSKKKKTQAKNIEYLKSIVHIVSVEQYGEMEYWFDEGTNKFLAQGRTAEEITEVLKTRFPNHVFVVENTGISAKTGWKFIPFTGETISFMSELINGKTKHQS